MKLFQTVGRRKIPGYKSMSLERELVVLDPKKVEYVYFPLVAANNVPLEVFVKEGDKVKVGTKIALKQQFSVPLFSSVSGTVRAIEKRLDVATGRPCDHLVIKNDFKMTKEKPLKKVELDAPKEDIVAAIKEAGIVGLGGANFPTWVKYNNVKDIHTILINAVECEPYLTTDYVSCSLNAAKVISGARYLQKAAGASKVIVAIKVKKEQACNCLKEAAAPYPDIEVREVPDRYPMGWERTLIQTIFKKQYDKLPSEIGVIVNNSTTAIAVHDALVEGSPIVSRIVTVSGNAVKNAANIVVPVGILAETVLNEFEVEEKEVVLLVGGPMTSNPAKDVSFALTVCHGALTLLEKVVYRPVACLRCGSCTAHCPAGLQPIEILRAFEGRDYERLEKLETLRCVDCGLCSYVCPSKIEVTDMMKKAKTLLRVHQSRKK